MNHSELSVIALPPRNAATDAAWKTLHRAATEPYRGQDRSGFSWFFARGKLALDPAFRAVLERGYLSRRHRVVDIGCGQGLLASLLQACNELQAAGRWPAAWPESPDATAYTGIEVMPRDVARAERAVSALPLAPHFVCADMRDAALPACDAVVILDVLHYVDRDAQAALLQRVRDALAPRGRLLLRVGDVADRRRFAVSQWVDRIVAGVRGHRVAPTWCRTLAEWKQLLSGLGFTVRSVPMSHGTPFANVLLTADLHDGGAR
jgi:SAM-dependent methyltransferase